MVRPRDLGGLGMASVWSDDFHHALHVLLTGERGGYYEDFNGIEDLAQSFSRGFVFTGQYSKYRKRRHGNSSTNLKGEHFIVCAQNHDQIGNRREGDRLGQILTFEQLKLAAGAVLLSPFLPLIFMGEEYGEAAPFQFFISHDDADLIEAVRQGRIAEFDCSENSASIPDPQSEETYLRSKLNWALRDEGWHKTLWHFHRELLRLRREVPALADLNMESIEVTVLPETLLLRRWSGTSEALAALHFGSKLKEIVAVVPRGIWRKRIDSSDAQWGTAGSALAAHFESAGEVTLTLSPCCVALFVRDARDAES